MLSSLLSRDRTQGLCQEGFGVDCRDLGRILGKSSSPRGRWGTGTAPQGMHTFSKLPWDGILGCPVQSQELWVIPVGFVLLPESFWKSLCCCARLRRRRAQSRDELELGGLVLFWCFPSTFLGLERHQRQWSVPGEFLGNSWVSCEGILWLQAGLALL